MQTIRRGLLIVGLAVSSILFSPQLVLAAPLTDCPTNVADLLKEPDIFIHPKCSLAFNILNVYVKLVSVAFLIAFITLVWVGYIYITSLGNAEKVNKAKELLGKVVVGIVILLLIPLILIAIAPTP